MLTPIQRAIEIVGSQQELARLCGVSQVAIHKWLRGGGINGKYISLIAQATNGQVTEIEILQSLTDTNFDREPPQ